MTAGALGAAPVLTAVLVGQVTVQGWSVKASPSIVLLTGYGGGIERKRWLLRHEGVAIH